MIDGLAVVDKPAGWTSHDVVGRCRKIFGQKKVGHSGTLDPDATGLLLVGLGRVTRLLRFLTDLPKTYETEVVFGRATSTLDDSGETTGEWDMAAIQPEVVVAASRAFVGDIEQIPPMVSAVKIGGRRLHELAREGIEIDRPPRPVTVYRYDLVATEDPLVYGAHIECSSGTYVRTLAADLGGALGGGAHIRHLRRTAIGSFAVADATPLDQLGVAHVLAPADALRDYPAVAVDAAGAAAVSFGKALPVEVFGISGDDERGPRVWRVVDEAGDLLAVYEHERGALATPAVVIRPASG